MKNSKKVILAVVGLPGAGKTTASEYLVKKNLPVVHFGKIVNDYIDKHGLEHTTDVHKKVWLSLREKFGQEAFAVLNEEKIRNALRIDSVIIDGMRSWEEYLYLKKKFPDVLIRIITVYAEKKKRYQRSAKRTDRPNLYGQDRDINELIGMNMGPTIAFADYLVINNSTTDKFYRNLDKVYKQVLAEV